MNKIIKDVGMGAFCLLSSLVLGFVFFQLPAWDFYSYHYYNGWAFLNDRIDIDNMPSMFRTFFNPVLDALLYFFINNFNEQPLIFMLLSTTQFAILMFLAYKLDEFMLRKCGIKDMLSLLFCLVSAGLSPVIVLCSFRFGYTDVLVAILVVAGLLIYVKNIFANHSGRLFCLLAAAFLIGLAFGLKYTSIAFAAAVMLTSVCLCQKVEKPIKTLMYMVVGLLVGFLISDGFWMLTLYQKFQNPFFPYFNNIFKSPMAEYDAVLGMDFEHLRPKNAWEFVFYPLKILWAKGVFVGIEGEYFDLKIPVAFFLVLALFVTLKLGQRKILRLRADNSEYFYLTLFLMVFSYYINLLLFANIRYIIPLFILAPVVICLFLHLFIPNRKVYCLSILLVLAAVCATYNYKGLNIRKWQASSKVIDIENMKFEDNSTVLLGFMTSFIVPNQNKNVKYIGYSMHSDLAERGFWNAIYKNKYFINKYNENVIKESVANSKNVYFVYSFGEMGWRLPDLGLYQESLERYSGKNVQLENCKDIKYEVYGNSSPGSYIFACKIK